MSDPSEHLARAVGVRRLDDVAVLRVSDEDRRTWLNGQITNDVSRLAPGAGVYALVVDLRGRVLGDLWAIDRGDDLALLVPKEAKDTLLQHFDKYIVMEDVEVEALDDVAVLSAQGPRAADLVVEGASRVDRLGAGGIDLVVPIGEADDALARLTDAARAIGGDRVDAAAWERARIRAGVPRYGVDFGESTLPQEAGLAARAVSFTKGCYLGQEAVCMLENRGKLRRRLVVVEADAPLTPGAALTLDGTEIGAITSSDGALAIALVKRTASEPGTALAVLGANARVVSVVGSGDPT